MKMTTIMTPYVLFLLLSLTAFSSISPKSTPAQEELGDDGNIEDSFGSRLTIFLLHFTICLLNPLISV